MVFGQTFHTQSIRSHHQKRQEKSLLLVCHRRSRLLPQPPISWTHERPGGEGWTGGRWWEHSTARRRHRGLHCGTQNGCPFDGCSYLSFSFGTITVDSGIVNGWSDLIRLCQPTFHLAAEQSHCCTRPFGARRSDQIHIIALLPFPWISFTLPQRTLTIHPDFHYLIIPPTFNTFRAIFLHSVLFCHPFTILETIQLFCLFSLFCVCLLSLWYWKNIEYLLGKALLAFFSHSRVIRIISMEEYPKLLCQQHSWQ